MGEALNEWIEHVDKNWRSIPSAEIDPKKLQHLGLICDGNRRAARVRGLEPFLGHQVGVEVIKGVARAGRKWNVKALTFWVWSTENWNRDSQQTDFVMNLAADNLGREDLLREFTENGVRFRQIGRKENLNPKLGDVIYRLEDSTIDNKNFYLNLALDYGGLDEVSRAIFQMTKDQWQGDAKSIYDYLDTAGQPLVDLVVRTGNNKGEVPHTSGFMPLQTAYAGWDFVPTLFPDLTPRRLLGSVDRFLGYDRRMGK